MTDKRYTRRAFLRRAGSTGAAVATLGTAWPRAAGARGRRRPTVAVFGGGIAGLTVAHELAERGFAVTVFERRAWGGKARSTDVPGSASGGRRPLPGEHGWRVFFGFYQNTIDTFRRIPFASNRQGVFGNIVEAPQLSFSRVGRDDVVLPLGSLDPRPYTPAQVIDLVVGVLLQHELPAPDVVRFAGRLLVYLSSCDARRLGEWEFTTWADFIQEEQCSEDFRRMIVNFASQWVQASKATGTSAQFSGHVLEWGIYSVLGRGANGPTIRILDRPTNAALIEPWLAQLRRLGTELLAPMELSGFETQNGQISAATIRDPGGTRRIRADWYVCALPVERARSLWTSPILAADPRLARMNSLSTGWMNGMKFFLREKTPLVEGHIYYADSPWTVGSVSQAQFWPFDLASTYGDGKIRESLSVDVSNWSQPGIIYGKPATECSPNEIANEVWEQMKMHLNKPGRPPQLTDDNLASWNIDPGMLQSAGRLISQDPLVLPTVGQRPDRPDVTTAIPNLLLAGDYLRSAWEVANMETASYNARRAVNALLERAGSTEAPAAVIEPYRPPEWEPLKQIDEQRYTHGQPNLFDTALGPIDELLSSPAGQLLGTGTSHVQQLLAKLAPGL